MVRPAALESAVVKDVAEGVIEADDMAEEMTEAMLDDTDIIELAADDAEDI